MFTVQTVKIRFVQSVKKDWSKETCIRSTFPKTNSLVDSVQNVEHKSMVSGSFLFVYTFFIYGSYSTDNDFMSYKYQKIERGIFGSEDFENFQKCPVMYWTVINSL